MVVHCKFAVMHTFEKTAKCKYFSYNILHKAIFKENGYYIIVLYTL